MVRLQPSRILSLYGFGGRHLRIRDVCMEFGRPLTGHGYFAIDPYHSAAMLSLGGIKTFVFARQASARREFSARLAV